MKKQICALLMVFVMAISFTACNGNTPDDVPDDATENSATDVISAVEDKVEQKSESTSEPVTAPDPGIDISGREVVDAGFFSVAYTEEWIYDEEKANIDDRYANIKFAVFGEDEKEQYSITLIATKDTASRYRNPFTSNGIDLRDLAEGKLDSVTIDNTVFYSSGGRSEVYRYRHDLSGVNYSVQFVTKENVDLDAPPFSDIIEGIKLNLTDDGEIPTPWPWDGERWTPKLSSEMIGTFTLTPVFIEANEPIISTTFLDSSFTVVGDMIYVVAGNSFSAYRMSGDKITFVETVKLDKEYNKIRSDKNGRLYLSPRMGKVDVYDGFTQVMATNAQATLVMHQSGDWGVNFWVGSDTEKITVQDGILKSEPWVIKNMNKDGNTSIFSQLRDIRITDSHIIVTGALTDKADVGVKIVIYDMTVMRNWCWKTQRATGPDWALSPVLRKRPMGTLRRTVICEKSYCGARMDRLSVKQALTNYLALNIVGWKICM